jgi:hypothetical protein
VVDLATDKLGLCVMKKCITNPFVINEVLDNLLVLIQDPYGNYLIQHMLEYQIPGLLRKILVKVEGSAV